MSPETTRIPTTPAIRDLHLPISNAAEPQPEQYIIELGDAHNTHGSLPLIKVDDPRPQETERGAKLEEVAKELCNFLESTQIDQGLHWLESFNVDDLKEVVRKHPEYALRTVRVAADQLVEKKCFLSRRPEMSWQVLRLAMESINSCQGIDMYAAKQRLVGEGMIYILKAALGVGSCEKLQQVLQWATQLGIHGGLPFLFRLYGFTPIRDLLIKDDLSAEITGEILSFLVYYKDMATRYNTEIFLSNPLFANTFGLDLLNDKDMLSAILRLIKKRKVTQRNTDNIITLLLPPPNPKSSTAHLEIVLQLLEELFSQDIKIPSKEWNKLKQHLGKLMPEKQQLLDDLEVKKGKNSDQSLSLRETETIDNLVLKLCNQPPETITSTIQCLKKDEINKIVELMHTCGNDPDFIKAVNLSPFLLVLAERLFSFEDYSLAFKYINQLIVVRGLSLIEFEEKIAPHLKSTLFERITKDETSKQVKKHLGLFMEFYTLMVSQNINQRSETILDLFPDVYVKWICEHVQDFDKEYLRDFNNNPLLYSGTINLFRKLRMSKAEEDFYSSLGRLVFASQDPTVIRTVLPSLQFKSIGGVDNYSFTLQFLALYPHQIGVFDAIFPDPIRLLTYLGALRKVKPTIAFSFLHQSIKISFGTFHFTDLLGRLDTNLKNINELKGWDIILPHIEKSNRFFNLLKRLRDNGKRTVRVRRRKMNRKLQQNAEEANKFLHSPKDLLPHWTLKLGQHLLETGSTEEKRKLAEKLSEQNNLDLLVNLATESENGFVAEAAIFVLKDIVYYYPDAKHILLKCNWVTRINGTKVINASAVTDSPAHRLLAGIEIMGDKLLSTCNRKTLKRKLLRLISTPLWTVGKREITLIEKVKGFVPEELRCKLLDELNNFVILPIEDPAYFDGNDPSYILRDKNRNVQLFLRRWLEVFSGLQLNGIHDSHWYTGGAWGYLILLQVFSRDGILVREMINKFLPKLAELSKKEKKIFFNSQLIETLTRLLKNHLSKFTHGKVTLKKSLLDVLKVVIEHCPYEEISIWEDFFYKGSRLLKWTSDDQDAVKKVISLRKQKEIASHVQPYIKKFQDTINDLKSNLDSSLNIEQLCQKEEEEIQKFKVDITNEYSKDAFITSIVNKYAEEVPCILQKLCEALEEGKEKVKISLLVLRNRLENEKKLLINEKFDVEKISVFQEVCGQLVRNGKSSVKRWESRKDSMLISYKDNISDLRNEMKGQCEAYLEADKKQKQLLEVIKKVEEALEKLNTELTKTTSGDPLTQLKQLPETSEYNQEKLMQAFWKSIHLLSEENDTSNTGGISSRMIRKLQHEQKKNENQGKKICLLHEEMKKAQNQMSQIHQKENVDLMDSTFEGKDTILLEQIHHLFLENIQNLKQIEQKRDKVKTSLRELQDQLKNAKKFLINENFNDEKVSIFQKAQIKAKETKEKLAKIKTELIETLSGAPFGELMLLPKTLEHNQKKLMHAFWEFILPLSRKNVTSMTDENDSIIDKLQHEQEQNEEQQQQICKLQINMNKLKVKILQIKSKKDVDLKESTSKKVDANSLEEIHVLLDKFRTTLDEQFENLNLKQLQKVLPKKKGAKLTYERIKTILSHAGFEKARQKGSHIVFSHSVIKGIPFPPLAPHNESDNCPTVYCNQVFEAIFRALNKLYDWSVPLSE